MLNFKLFYTQGDFKNETLGLFSYDVIIDYNIIISKLIKNDIYKITPTDSVISITLLKELDNIFKDKTNLTILYILKYPNESVIDNIRSILFNLSNKYNKKFSVELFVKSKENISLDNCKVNFI